LIVSRWTQYALDGRRHHVIRSLPVTPARHARRRAKAHQGGDMTIETLERPIEPESAIMKGQ
jgi:hypothetical protein